MFYDVLGMAFPVACYQFQLHMIITNTSQIHESGFATHKTASSANNPLVCILDFDLGLFK